MSRRWVGRDLSRHSGRDWREGAEAKGTQPSVTPALGALTRLLTSPWGSHTHMPKLK